VRPSGYFNQKARRLKAFAGFYLAHGGESGIRCLPDPRQALLALHGIGPETADSMLLYALDMPVFVIDAYTRRIFARLGETPPDASYAALQEYFHARLTPSVPLFREYHALLVAHAKRHCRKRPLCAGCPLQKRCAHARGAAGALDGMPPDDFTAHRPHATTGEAGDPMPDAAAPRRGRHAIHGRPWPGFREG
ncbi:MAG TPA: hypothetical protein VNH42_04335, partial [Mariprofundaceae bacterium]|nr:hypothetical protein [Mariprofundaceae bacterium]